MTLPILISGAGPSGLTLALELAQRNIPFEIFDKASGPAPIQESRALAFNPRSQAILEKSGVTKAILEEGHPILRARFSWEGRRLAEIATILPSHPTKKIISIPQGRVERLLLKTLEERGHQPHWNTEVIGFKEDNHEISADVVSKTKQSVRTGRYLIGCDGAHSIVRKSGSYFFEGESDPQIWKMADIILDNDEFANTISADFFTGGANATIAIKSNHLRIIRAGHDDIENHPMMARAKKVLWKSQFKVSYRMVREFQRGRTFLCGDAGHIHSPVGGRGMNLGIEDAATLAYLLQENREHEYSAMRIPIAKQVLKFTHTQTRQILSKSLSSRLAKQYFLPLAIKFRPARNSILKTILALDTPDPVWM